MPCATLDDSHGNAASRPADAIASWWPFRHHIRSQYTMIQSDAPVDHASIDKLVNYAPLASPKSLDLEHGTLRPANGPISIYDWQNLGMAAHLAGVGVVFGTVSGVVYSVLNNYLHMSPTLVATATALIQFPRALRIFTGMLTDRVPIFGYRRRPYMLLGWLLSFVSCLTMAAIPLGKPYYSDPSLAKIPLADLTPEQLATVNVDAPDQGIKLIILMMVANFGIVMAYSGFNGVLVDVSQREPERMRGTAMADCTIVHYVFGVLSAFMTGLGLNGVDYGGSFSWTIGFNTVMWICAGASLLTLPFTVLCIKEERHETLPTKSVFRFLYELLQLRVMYRFVAFNFFYNVFSLFSVTASSAVQSDWAKVEPINSGIANMLTALLTVAGTYVVRTYGLSWNWHHVIITCQVGVVLLDIVPTFFTIWDVVRSQWLWLGVPLLEKAPAAAIGYVTGLFVFEVSSVNGFEATLMGLSVSTQEVGIPFATVLTKSINGYLDLERSTIARDDTHARSQVSYAYVIMYAINILSLVFIAWLPRQKKELREMEQEGRRSKVYSAITLSYLVFSLAWTLMTNVLSLFSSTSCLRIAGGSGC